MKVTDASNGMILSGYTYFGQFIDHDLTRDETKLRDAGRAEPNATTNHRNPFLDLDSLYGRGPEAELLDPSIAPEHYLYEHSAPQAECFRLGHVNPPRGRFLRSIERSDLPRDAALRAVIGDDRNDENDIIAQLTVLFLKFHNRILDLIEQPKPLIEDAGGETLFEKARRLVIWHYQYIAVNDFLKQVLLGSVWNEVFGKPGYKPRLFKARPGQPVALPVEFTMAAFRFGHSMVRPDYQLNDKTKKQLRRLLRHKPRRLQPEDVIEWSRFFGKGSGQNAAQPIDTLITDQLYTLPPHVIQLFTGSHPSQVLSLPARTLLRGSLVGLPSGQEACGQARVAFQKFQPDDSHYEFLKSSGMQRRTPLWFYLLHEAQVAGNDVAGIQMPKPESNTRFLGSCLGLIGSRIVAEVFLALLAADKSSYWHSKPRWHPPVPRFDYSGSGKPEAIEDMAHLVKFCQAPT